MLLINLFLFVWVVCCLVFALIAFVCLNVDCAMFGLWFDYMSLILKRVVHGLLGLISF